MRKIHFLAASLALTASACGKVDKSAEGTARPAATEAVSTKSESPSPSDSPGPKFGKGPRGPSFPAISEAIGSVKPERRAAVMSEVVCRSKAMDAVEILSRKPDMIREVAASIEKPGFRSAC